MESILGRAGSKIMRMRQRTWLKLFVAACAIWLCWYPKRMDSLFMALPTDATMASYHEGLASEWKALVNNDVVIQMLKGFGVEDADELRDNVGIYQTLYWLTGRHTVIGFVPLNQPGDLPGYLVGSSYVGWKAKPMEFLWRIKWVPGLGRLGVTSHGTRYLKFDDDTFREMGLVLGLDMVDGVLVATLSRDPETVCVMADRLHRFGPANSPAVAFGDERPWENLTDARHKVWITDDKLVSGGETVTAEMSPWGGHDFNLSIRGGLNVAGTAGTKCFRDFDAKTFPGADVPDSAATLLLAFDAQRVSSLGGMAPPAGEGLGLIYVSGKPYEGRLMGLAYPALNAALPWSAEEDFGAWSSAWAEEVKALAGEGARLTTKQVQESGHALLYLSSALLDVFGASEVGDMAFMEVDHGLLRAGSHYGSYEKQRADFARTQGERSLADQVAAWQRADPDTFAALRLNVPTAAVEFGHLAGVAKLGLSLGGGSDAKQTLEQIKIIGTVLRGLSPLGTIECLAGIDGDGLTTLDISTRSEKARE